MSLRPFHPEEDWPVYRIDDSGMGFAHQVEMTDEEFERYVAANIEWDAVQKMIGDRIGWQT